MPRAAKDKTTTGRKAQHNSGGATSSTLAESRPALSTERLILAAESMMQERLQRQDQQDVRDACAPKARNWSVPRPLYNGPKRSNGPVPVPWPSAVSRVPRLPPTGSYAGFPSGGAAAGAVAGQAGPPSFHLGGPIYDSAGPVLGAAGAAPAGMRGGGFSGAGPSHFGAPPGFRPTLGPGLPPPPRGMLGGGSAGPRPSHFGAPPGFGPIVGLGAPPPLGMYGAAGSSGAGPSFIGGPLGFGAPVPCAGVPLPGVDGWACGSLGAGPLGFGAGVPSAVPPGFDMGLAGSANLGFGDVGVYDTNQPTLGGLGGLEVLVEAEEHGWFLPELTYEAGSSPDGDVLSAETEAALKEALDKLGCAQVVRAAEADPINWLSFEGEE